MSRHVFSILEEAASMWGERTAIVESGRNTSYIELLEYSSRLCKLLESAAALKGKGIAFICSNGRRFVAGLFACSKAGAVPMPVLPGTKEAELESLFRESAVEFLLVERGNQFSFTLPLEKLRLNEDFDLYRFPGISSIDIDLIFPGAAFIRPSSGTTGSSKGVVISHRAVFERTEAANEGLKLNEESIMLWVLPMAFHFIVSVILYLRYGVRLVVSDHFTAGSILEQANLNRATHLYASPLHYRLLAAETGELKFETLKNAISTSALLEPAVSKAYFEKYGHPIAQAYGIIEIGLPFINNEMGILRTESIGKALPRYKAAILDGNGMEVRRGVQGAFAITGPGMFSGYLWPLKRVEEVLVNSWFLTGDIAEMDAEGFVFIKGRNKSMINVSGNKVFPEEVEAVLMNHPGVEEVRVFGGKHPLTGELVVAEIVLKPTAVENTEEIISFCRDYLPSYKIPQRIYFVNELAKTRSGKISRA